jgi:hypothetical protein
MGELNDAVLVNQDDQQEIDKLMGGVEDGSSSCSRQRIEINNNIDALKHEEQNGCGDDDYDAGF